MRNRREWHVPTMMMCILFIFILAIFWVQEEDNFSQIKSFETRSKNESYDRQGVVVNHSIETDEEDFHIEDVNNEYKEDKEEEDDDVFDVAQPPQKEFTCAPWIPAEKRKILMHSLLQRFTSWEDHQDGLHVKGGESYWSACIHRALVDLGFEVEMTNEQTSKLSVDGDEFQKLERGDIHRFVTDSSSGGQFAGDIWGKPDLLCKVRMMSWWPAAKRPKHEFSISPIRYDEVATTSAHFVPFFVHAALTDPPIKKMIPRNRRAIFIFDKLCGDLKHDVIRALDNAGFELYFQCQNSRLPNGLDDIAGNFTQFENLFDTPREYQEKILQKVAMVLGFGAPVDSPTALEALYNGAAFLNPEYDPPFESHEVLPRTHMHKALKNLGPPYVYNYNGNYLNTRSHITANNYKGDDFSTKEDMETMISSILEVAERAAAQPFVSYTPADYSYESVKAHVCANIIEYDPCWIPGQT
mmetsp:Transcript_17661/g.42518  ORF Transcript_17661/g.42518 Transcript_17661/m.42518 type:complete len:469 (+) Transcript_17661:123-1529(+)